MRTATTGRNDWRSGGFENRAAYYRSVGTACALNWRSPADQRLSALVETTSSEGDGESGGFAVPPWWAEDILAVVLGPTSIAGRCLPVPVPRGNEVVLALDETTPWQSTGGVQVYWADEGSALTQSKLQLQGRTMRLRKLIALCPVSDTLLDDSNGLDVALTRAAQTKLGYALDNALLNGIGGPGRGPLGLLNAPCKVVVDPEVDQDADTFTLGNARGIASRMLSTSRQRATWIMGSEVFAMVESFPYPAYQAATAESGPRLLGNEIVLSEACQAIGDEGDVYFADLQSYLLARRARNDVSMHLFFDYATTTFKWSLRVDGMPALHAPLSRPNSTATASTVITLAARA